MAKRKPCILKILPVSFACVLMELGPICCVGCPVCIGLNQTIVFGRGEQYKITSPRVSRTHCTLTCGLRLDLGSPQLLVEAHKRTWVLLRGSVANDLELLGPGDVQEVSNTYSTVPIPLAACCGKAPTCNISCNPDGQYSNCICQCSICKICSFPGQYTCAWSDDLNAQSNQKWWKCRSIAPAAHES